MDIKVIASGSAGNAYIVSDGSTHLLLECGIPFQELKEKTDFFRPLPHGCLITHAHADHSLSFNEVANVGIPIYTSTYTKYALTGKADSDYRIRTVKSREPFTIGTFEILPLDMAHDVYCLGFVIVSTYTKEKLFFATDTYYIKYQIPNCDYIMVEANYDLDILNSRIRNSDVDMIAKKRLMQSHMEIGSTLRWLTANDLTKTKRIYLMHLSDGSSNEEEFKRRVQEATGIPVTIC